jgi:hypothetical protein
MVFIVESPKKLTVEVAGADPTGEIRLVDFAPGARDNGWAQVAVICGDCAKIT